MKKREHYYESKNKFEGGSTRSKSQYAYHLIPVCALDAMSDRWWLGATKHGEGNWKQGGVGYIKQCFNHLINHYRKELEYDFDLTIERETRTDSNLGAILWAAGALTWFKKYKNQEYKQALKEIQEGLVQNVHNPKPR
jgi:Domain of unknown function (DUF5664)